MKYISKTIQVVLFTLSLFCISIVRGQEKSTNFETSVAYKFPKNNEKNPCISSQEYSILEKEVVDNIKKLGVNTLFNKSSLTTSLLWPLKQATGFTQCEYHFIAAYVDQNTAASAIQDYNCESNTYDGHHGTDIAIWPYSFNKMENNEVEVIAAAPGTIIQKADGNFDRNCSSNTLTANSVIIQHADGSYALYWHMKKNSVTTKTVGQTVVAGEKLGIVGSSGSASGPHLHFEIWSGNTKETYKDPFAGSCNILNANSWWASQRPHTEPAIMRVSVNTTDIALANCPNSDVITESDTFVIPFQGVGLSAGYAKFYVFLRELPASATVNLEILNPNGTVFNSWSQSFPTYSKLRYWGFSKLLPTAEGLYTFKATYNGISCSKTFTIVKNPLATESNKILDRFIISPNPTKNSFQLSGKAIENEDYTLTLSSITGQTLTEEKIKPSNGILKKSFSIEDVSDGIYFLNIASTKSRTIKKIIKQ
jgi:murein DD-endopeptidase MepM/ murein hydrolase activator NlpD